MNEIVAFEEQRLTGLFGEAVGEAVAKVEVGLMAAFAEAAVGFAGHMGLLLVEGDHFYVELVDKTIKESHATNRSSAYKNEGRFHQ